MSNNTELFNLCKAVYEATGWDDTAKFLWLDDSCHQTRPELDTIETATHDMSGKGTPLYTSDYLLEKLPKVIDAEDDAARANWRHLRMTAGLPDGYNYYYEGLVLDVTADTPLKALLKLTLKLHEEEIL